MSVDACTKLVKSGDRDRFLSASTAPSVTRSSLMAIYAVNLEIARAPWASPEPLVAQMRLRWWADAIAGIYRGETPDSHEVLPALREVIFDFNLPHSLFEALIDARHFDIFSNPHEHRAAFDAYINATSGSVMELAARVLGAEQNALPVLRDFAYGAGVANLLRAVPELEARGRKPLPSDYKDVVQQAKQKVNAARSLRREIPAAVRPALLAGWRVDATLSAAGKHPKSIQAGLLEESPAWRMISLRWKTQTGRW